MDEPTSSVAGSSDQDENAPVRQDSSSLPAPSPRGTGFTTKTKVIALGAAIVILTGVSVSVGLANSSHTAAPTPEQTASAPANVLTETEQIQEKLAARPEIGSPAYFDLFKGVVIPYVEGQSHTDVIAATFQALDNFYELGWADAPQTYDEQTKWALDNVNTGIDVATREGTVNGIIDQLDLGYYTNGLGEALFGPNWKSSPFAQQVIGNYEGSHRNAMTFYLMHQENPANGPTLADANIIQENATDIIGTARAFSETATKKNPDLSYSFHLQKSTDEQSPRWVVVGNENDRITN